MTLEINSKGIEDWAKGKDKKLLNMFKKIGVEGSGLLVKEAKKVWYTGNTARSIAHKPTSTEVKIQATTDYATQALETGVPPGTKVSGKALSLWAAKKLGNAGLGYAIAKKIEKQGSAAYRKGGRKGVTKVLNQLKNKIVPNHFQEVLEIYAN